MTDRQNLCIIELRTNVQIHRLIIFERKPKGDMLNRRVRKFAIFDQNRHLSWKRYETVTIWTTNIELIDPWSCIGSDDLSVTLKGGRRGPNFSDGSPMYICIICSTV